MIKTLKIISAELKRANDLKQREDEAYGYSTFVMIAESHLSVHTFPELNYVSFDCFSCKDFDHALQLKYQNFLYNQ